MKPTLPISPPNRNVTMKEVASRAGVTYASVSVVLNGSRSGTHVSENTRRRILEAAEELGYRRNVSAAGMKSGRFGSLALLSSTNTSASALPVALWNGIMDEMATQNLHLVVARLPDAHLTDEALIPKILREYMVDGLLIDYTHAIPQAMITLIEKYRLPAIWINVKRDYDCVHPDDFAAGQNMGRFLLQQQHRQVAFAMNTVESEQKPLHYSVFDRLEALKSEIISAGGAVETVSPPDMVTFNERVSFWKNWLQHQQTCPQRATAVVSYSILQNEPLRYAACELGLRVPEQLSVLYFGSAHDGYWGPATTSLIVPEYEMGRHAVKMLIAKTEIPEVQQPACALPFEWRDSKTTLENQP